MHCDVVSCLAVVDDVRGGGMLLVTGRYFLFYLPFDACFTRAFLLQCGQYFENMGSWPWRAWAPTP